MNIPGLSQLFADIQATFTADTTTARLVFGQRETSKNVNQGAGRANRVCIVPGVDGKMGKFAPARRPGANPRPLRTFLEDAEIYCWAYDGTAPNDERKQYEAARALFDATIRAIYISPNVGHGQIQLGAPERVGDVTERTFGFEIKFTLTIESQIVDSGFDTTTPPTTIDIANAAGIGSSDTADGTDVVIGVP